MDRHHAVRHDRAGVPPGLRRNRPCTGGVVASLRRPAPCGPRPPESIGGCCAHTTARGPLRLPLRRSSYLLVLSLLGAVLVGVPSLLLALQEHPVYEIRVQARLLDDPEIGDEAAVGGKESELENFIDTELVTLNSDALRDRVATLQDDPELEVSAVRVGSSNVVEITVRSNEQDVDDSADAVISRYVEGRRAELQERILGIGGEVDRQLAVANASIVALAGDDSITAQLQRAALTAELTRLFQQRNTLQLASNASSRLVQVVTTSSDGVQQVVHPVRNGALGALAGGVLGLALGLGLERLRPRVRGLEDLLEMAPEVALPTLRRVRGHDLAARAGAATSSYVSALTSGTSRFGEPPLVVVGPSAGCGATFVAVGLAVASARRRPTVLVAAGDAFDAGAARLLGLDPALTRGSVRGLTPIDTRFPGLSYAAVGTPEDDDPAQALEARVAKDILRDPELTGRAVVVDAPPLEAGAAALELARQSGRVLLVAAVARTSADELDLAARSLRRVGASLSGVLLNEAPRGGGSRSRRNRRRRR